MNYKIGQEKIYSRTITEDDVFLFAKITGDYNSLHVDEEEAKKSVFGSRIVHGVLVLGYVSTVLGMYLPGDGTIYLETYSKFLKPVYIGDTITVRIVIEEIVNIDKRIMKLKTEVINQDGVHVMEGYSVVKAPEKEMGIEVSG